MKKTINTVQRKNENKIMQKNRGEYEEEQMEYDKKRAMHPTMLL